MRGALINNKTIPPYLADQEKVGFDFGPDPLASNDTGLYAPSVPVPQFNQAAWRDV
jgi:hypothetical protein